MVIAMAAYRPVSVIQSDLMEIKAAGQQPPHLRTFPCSRYFAISRRGRMLVSLIRVALFVTLAAFITSPIRADSLQRADGSLITYHLLNRATEGRQSLILMLQGSGCGPVIERKWLRTEPPALAPGRAVLAIEKYGVADGNITANGFEDGCSHAYWRGNTLHQRVFDATQTLAHLRKEEW